MQATTNRTVDIVLALALASGSAIGAQVGARLSKFLRGEQLRIVLASVVLATCAKMAMKLLIEPTIHLSVAGGK